MRINMNDGQLQTIEPVKRFVEGSQAVEFRGITVRDKYSWIEEALRRVEYQRLERSAKGVIRGYTRKMTVYSRARVARLVAEYHNAVQN